MTNPQAVQQTVPQTAGLQQVPSLLPAHHSCVRSPTAPDPTPFQGAPKTNEGQTRHIARPLHMQELGGALVGERMD